MGKQRGDARVEGVYLSWGFGSEKGRYVISLNCKKLKDSRDLKVYSYSLWFPVSEWDAKVTVIH